MLNITDLLAIAELYRIANGISRMSTVSYRVFGDNKRLASLAAGGEITVGRFNDAMAWFGRSWPEDAERPALLADFFPTAPAPTPNKDAA